VKRDGDSITGPSTLSSVLSASSVPWWLDVVGVGCVLAAGIAVMVPVLIHGSSFGPFSVLAQDGLLRQHRTGTNNPFGGDLVTQMLPWASLAWKQVHHGFLPLWNPFNASGTPLAFNWQSATFSLPAVVGYLVPLAVAYTTQVLVTLAIGGTGVYFLTRIMRLNLLGCVFAGMVFELSGSFIGWLGWPVASVMSWSGWLFGAALLVVRGRHRARSIVLLAVAAALAVYAGQPDTLFLMGCFLSVFVVILLAAEAGPGANRLRRAGDLLVAVLAGLGLAAPLLLPGTQLLSMSSRDVGGALLGQHAPPLQKLVVVAIPGLNGFPVGWNRSYIGMLAVILALVGLIVGRRRPQVLAIGAVAIVAGVVCFTPVVSSVLDDLPAIGVVRWTRSTSFLEFAVAVLAGVGMDALTRWSPKRDVLRLAVGAFSLAALVVALIWAIHPQGDPTRHRNLAWAFGGAVLGLMVTGVLALARRREGRADRQKTDASLQRLALARTGGILALVAGILLVVYQGAFLLVTGGNQLSSTSRPFHPTAAEQLLAKTVGSSLVGFGSTACVSPPVLGIPVNANIAYGMRELAVYDPVLPKDFYFSWSRYNGSSAGHPATSHYCPAVTSAVVARRYGVSFVLEFRGARGPTGSIFVKRIGGEDLYRIPGSGEATVVPLPSDRLPPVDAPGTLVAPTGSDPSSLRIAVDPARPSVLRLRLSDVPGWHASIDGRPLVLQSFEGVMLQAKIPAGAHTIEVQYWPVSFTVGIVLAAISACGLISLGVVGVARRRRASSRGSLST
jgi:hypothetical protein